MTTEELAITYPEATLVGSTVLHREGWKTQIPVRVHVAVLDARMPVAAEGFEIVGRPASWFRPTETTLLGLRALTPIDAVVDAWRHRTSGDRTLTTWRTTRRARRCAQRSRRRA